MVRFITLAVHHSPSFYDHFPNSWVARTQLPCLHVPARLLPVFLPHFNLWVRDPDLLRPKSFSPYWHFTPSSASYSLLTRDLCTLCFRSELLLKRTLLWIRFCPNPHLLLIRPASVFLSVHPSSFLLYQFNNFSLSFLTTQIGSQGFWTF